MSAKATEERGSQINAFIEQTDSILKKVGFSKASSLLSMSGLIAFLVLELIG